MDGDRRLAYGLLTPQPTVYHTQETRLDTTVQDKLRQKPYPGGEVVYPVRGTDRIVNSAYAGDLMFMLADGYRQKMGAYSTDNTYTHVMCNLRGLPIAPGRKIMWPRNMTPEQIDQMKSELLMENVKFLGAAMQSAEVDGDGALPEHYGFRVQTFGNQMVLYNSFSEPFVGMEVSIGPDMTKLPSAVQSADDDNRVTLALHEFRPVNCETRLRVYSQLYREKVVEGGDEGILHFDMENQSVDTHDGIYHGKSTRIAERAASGVFALIMSALPVLAKAGIIPDMTAGTEATLADKLGFTGRNSDPELIAALIDACILGNPSARPKTTAYDHESLNETGAAMLFAAYADIVNMNRPVGKIVAVHERTSQMPQNKHAVDLFMNGQ